MPLYNYECLKCKEISEIYVSTDDVVKCPLCKSKRMKRFFGKSSIIMERRPDAPTTPIDCNEKVKVIGRIPEYADRKTGKKLGFGKPETVVVNEG